MKLWKLWTHEFRKQYPLTRARVNAWAFGEGSGFVAPEAISATTALYIALAAAAVSAGVQVYGQHQAAAAEKRNAKAGANAAAMQAEHERLAGEARAKQVRLAARRELSKQGALAGKAGVEDVTGSLLEVQMEGAALAEYEAALARYPHQLASQRASFESTLLNRRAAQAKVGFGTYVGAAASLASTGASAYTGYLATQPKVT